VPDESLGGGFLLAQASKSHFDSNLCPQIFARLMSVSNSSQFAGLSNQLRGCKSRHGYSSGQAARLRALARPQRSPTSVLPPTLVNACERLSPWARPFCPCRPAAGPRFFKPNNAGAIPATDSNGPMATVIEFLPNSLMPKASVFRGRTSPVFAARAGHRRGSYPRARWFDSISCDDRRHDLVRTSGRRMMVTAAHRDRHGRAAHDGTVGFKPQGDTTLGTEVLRSASGEAMITASTGRLIRSW